jgi:3-methyl-2-oxobutanoate hydroxymethyltransferase
MQDMLGINKDFKPRFLILYDYFHMIVTDAVEKYVTDVKAKSFPSDKEKY